MIRKKRDFKTLILVILISLVFSFFQLSYGLGFLVSSLSLLIMKKLRSLFYQRLFDDGYFSKGMYGSYVLLTFLILWFPLLLAFLKPETINPYVMALVFIGHRIIMFLCYSFDWGE